ncbi:Non-reducing polyketide synthase 1 [Pseudocercospora fuligena]|uniref:Non-reducing polyketide synthase 1 n=1 Tax=Pseudocercospora fuligena TaxID=685502 RepID=A0A8H6VLJ1_9PEZI|nr:Non-reducing polyketide synthase 1 [Pseudocercospora fuligena]
MSTSQAETFPPFDNSFADIAVDPANMKRLSPSCQQLVSEKFDDALSTSKIIIRSALADRELAPIVMNHKCNGCVLTPAGLNLDMAHTVAKYIYHHHNGEDAELPGIKIYDTEIHKPLIVKDIEKVGDLWIEMETTIEHPAQSTSTDIMNATIKCVFHSITPQGVRLQECGYCYIKFEPYQAWLDEWEHYTPFILDRIANLHRRACTENNMDVQLVQRAAAYKLFESFVQYNSKYQNMSEVVFNTKNNEATSIIDLPHLDPNTDFTGPYYLDASCHISGFVANAVEPDKDKNAFVSHGVAAMKLSPKFQPDRVAKLSNATTPTTPAISRAPSFSAEPANVAFRGIRNYVQMRQDPSEKSVIKGDVFVLQDGEIVGVWEGVRFKKIPRRVLNVFLPPPKRKVSFSQNAKK